MATYVVSGQFNHITITSSLLDINSPMFRIARSIVAPLAATAGACALLAVRGGRADAAAASAPAKAPSGEVSPAAAAPVVFVPLDLSRLGSMDHHFLRTMTSVPRALEDYRVSISQDRSELRLHVRLGERACGHKGIVHGGAISAIYDDAMGILFLAQGANGFTAKLEVNYRKPLPAGEDIVVSVRIDGSEDSKSGKSKKVLLSARMVAAADSSVVYSDSTSLYIAPNGSLLSTAVYKLLSSALLS